mgnify:CR=1 FL=1
MVEKIHRKSSTMNIKVFGLVFLALLIILGIFSYSGSVKPRILGALSLLPTATASKVDVGIGSSTQLFQSNVALCLQEKSGVEYRSFSNPGPVPVSLFFNMASTTFSSSTGGFILFVSSTHEMAENLGNLWPGNVWCAARLDSPGAGTSTIHMFER